MLGAGMRGLLRLFPIALIFLTTVSPAAAEKQLALVIGNDRYPNLPADQQLQKAANDARAVGDVLGPLGFEVIRAENVSRQELVDKLDELTGRLTPGDSAFFFFAGHGVSIGGGNYLLPSDVPNVGSNQETRLARAAIGENDIVADLQARGVRVAIVVLDACRNNPFKKPGVRAVGGERGLARTDPVRGVFALYSAGIGQTALDRLSEQDPDPNSVFTRTLVRSLQKPGLHLGDLAFEVREEVARLARTIGHDQRPASYDETLGGRIYLAGRPAAEPPGNVPAGGPFVPVPDPCQTAESHWRATEASGTARAYRDHLGLFPQCGFAKLAAAKFEDLSKPPPDPCAGAETHWRTAEQIGAYRRIGIT